MMASDSTICAKPSLAALFWEWFKIALFVVGGGYAIIVVADDVFGRRRRWIAEGELLEHLPIISSVPGLIAGNSAIYVGLKTRGRLGAVASLMGVALPSIMIFLAVSAVFASIPKDNAWIDGAFLGLRSALSGVIAATIWRALFRSRADWSKGAGIELRPLSRRQRVLSVGILSSLFALAAVFAGDSLFAFLKFGCVAIGGGFPLIPFYSRTFVGPESALLQMRPEDFSNLMALTQMTPGPVSLNAATFFGYSLDGALGAVVASTALLTPSYFMLSSVLTGLNRCRNNPAVRVFLSLLTPVSVVLMSLALRQFCSVSIWESSSDGLVFRPYALCLAVFAAVMLEKRKLSVMALIFVCAALGALSVLAA